MPFNDTRALWTPGRVHVGAELETEFNAGVTSLANGAVQRADFAPEARLPPFVFASGRTRTPLEFMWHGLPTTTATLYDSLWLPRNMRIRLDELHIYVERNPLQPFGYTITGTLVWMPRDGSFTVLFGSATAPAGAERTTGIQTFPASVLPERGARIGLRLQGTVVADPLVYVRVRAIVLGAARWTRAD